MRSSKQRWCSVRASLIFCIAVASTAQIRVARAAAFRPTTTYRLNLVTGTAARRPVVPFEVKQGGSDQQYSFMSTNETKLLASSSDDIVIVPPAPPSPRWWKNVNEYYVVVTGICSWFLFWHSPVVLRQMPVDKVFLIHLVGAYSVSIACMTNTLTTPSIAGSTWHIMVGRVGMFSGFASFVAGAFCAWWPWRPDLPPRSFAIGITIGGICQVAAQIAGLKAIRKFQQLKSEIQVMESSQDGDEERKQSLTAQRDGALKEHVYNMIGVFAAGCGCPAAIRLLETLGVPYLPGLFLSVVGLSGAVRFWGDRYFKK